MDTFQLWTQLLECKTHNHLVQDDWQIQSMAVPIVLVIFWVHMDNLFLIKGKIFELIKRSYRFS